MAVERGRVVARPAFESLLRTATRAVRPGGRLAWSYFVPRPEPLPAALRDRLAPLAVPDVLDRSLIRFQRVLAEVR